MSIKLTPRTALILDMCASGRRLADIGCDHGYLSAAFLRQGGEYAYACDLNPGPLEKARETLTRGALLDRAETVLCNGLSGIDPATVDTIAICGMGGILIAEIMEACPWSKSGAHTFILQPMSHESRLRKYLFEQGFDFADEALAKEGDRLYAVMQVTHSGKVTSTDNLDYSDKMTKDPLFNEYLSKITNKRQEIEKKRAGK